MLKRLLVGLLKGLVIGGAIAAGIQYGLPAAHVVLDVPSGGLLGFLLAMGVAGTTGIFAGRPPWQQGAWIEAALKGMVGVGAGALVYWLGSTYGALSVPFPGLAEAAPWTSIPVLFLPVISGTYGAVVELDNTGGDDAQSGKGDAKKSAAKVRVDVDADTEIQEEAAAETRAAKKRR